MPAVSPVLVATAVIQLAEALEIDKQDTDGKSLLGRVIEKFAANVGTATDDELEELLDPEMLIPRLRDLVRRPGEDKLTLDMLRRLVGTCLGRVSSGGLFGGSRTPIRPQDGTRNGDGSIDFIYEVNEQSASGLNGVTLDQVKKAVWNAWKIWQKKLPERRLVVRRANDIDEAPNLKIVFRQLDGAGNKLAEAPLGAAGTVEVDSAEPWTLVKLTASLTHEFGHVMGIDHIGVPGSIMYFQSNLFYSTPGLSVEDIKLHDADVAEIPAYWKP